MKYFLIIIGLIILLYVSLWVLSRKNYPVKFGISFNHNHAESLGLDWKDVYADMISELKPEYIRIAAMWSEIEKEKNEYYFENVDFMMKLAEENNVKVTLVVGQKAPRWPECHVPAWIATQKSEDAKARLFNYISTIVDRYKESPSLEFWQVENEPFIKFRFGDCSQYREELVDEEIELVKEIDSNHPIIITDSGELSTWRRAIKTSDYFGTTLYRIIRNSKGKIFSYDWLPPAVYRWRAKIWGQDMNKMFVSELQAEPWFTSSNPTDTPLEIQEQTMNPTRLRAHMDYAKKIGVPRAYLWGVEWWYWVKEVRGDERYWNMVKNEINRE
ncbi:MAG: endo-1,4-beta-xylanase [bacterium]|nr:endo-1,4-beta-xylanase [bacterium]